MCQHFGWTIDELYDQPQVKLERFAVIMKIEGQVQELKAKELQQGKK